jgi:hypothetical protein
MPDNPQTAEERAAAFCNALKNKNKPLFEEPKVVKWAKDVVLAQADIWRQYLTQKSITIDPAADTSDIRHVWEIGETVDGVFSKFNNNQSDRWYQRFLVQFFGTVLKEQKAIGFQLRQPVGDAALTAAAAVSKIKAESDAEGDEDLGNVAIDD